MMKRIRVFACGDPEVMKLEEVPDPQPATGQIVVNVHAIGVNPVDTYLRAGGQGYTPNLPYTPGFDAAGQVEIIGEDVTHVAKGDRVYCAGTLSGAYAEKTLCDQSQIHPLPENISFAQGASLGVPYTTAYRGLFQRAQARPGDIILVHGASGGVGLAAVQLARAAGMTVLGTVGTEQAQRLVNENGAHKVLNHQQPKHLQNAFAFTGDKGINVILEMLANVNLGNDLKVLAKGGRVVIIGSRGDVQITPRDLMGRDASILGMSVLNTSQPDLDSIHSYLAAGLANGTLHPVIGRELPLSEAVQAHHLIMESSAYGKIVLIP